MTGFYLPTDGSVIVVDDKHEQALPLIKLLSSKGIACTYYDGTESELPNTPTQKVRIAFFDIQLTPLLSPHDYAQIIQGLLEKLIPIDNGPYILVLWSKRIEGHADTVQEQVMAETCPRRPHCVIKLDKNLFFETIPDNDIQDAILQNIDDVLGTAYAQDDLDRIKDSVVGGIPLQSKYEKKGNNTFNQIEVELHKGLKKKAVSFQFFTIWESLINKASGQTVENYSSLHELDENWQDNLKNSIFRMAQAQLGEYILKSTDRDIITNAVTTMNSSFFDISENHCQNLPDISADVKFNKNNIVFANKIEGINYKLYWNAKSKNYKLYADTDLLTPNPIKEKNLPKQGRNVAEKSRVARFIASYENIKPSINTRLHIDVNPADHVQPGNVYLKENIHWTKRKKYIQSYYQRDNDLDLNQRNQFIFIELEVSPICDYAQKKWLKYRLLPGIMIPEDFTKNTQTGEAIYLDLPLIKYGDKKYKILFNYQLLKSIHKDQYSNTLPIFKIRHELSSSIQSGLSGHGNRKGITIVD